MNAIQKKLCPLQQVGTINLAYLEKVHRSIHLCILKKDSTTHKFEISSLRIRYLDGLV